MTEQFTEIASQCLEELDEARAIDRMWGRDGKMWVDNEGDAAKIRNRLGWLFCVPTMHAAIERLVNLSRTAERRGFDRALIVGMGGSSLWPEVVGRHLGGHRGLKLRVLDCTHPEAIADAIAWASAGSSMFIIATKSGGTVETLSLYRILRDRFDDGSKFIAITDPGSKLTAIARREKFTEVFENPSDIGGRFSAGSFFGLVPAVLAGVVIKDAIARLDDALAECRLTPAADNPGAQLAAFLATGHRLGRSHLRLSFGKDVRGFAAWVEQLIAESTGKLGTGILPVPGRYSLAGDKAHASLKHSLIGSLATFDNPDDEFGMEAEDCGAPVTIQVMPEAADLWAEIVRWEVATALCGKLLGINPFDEPDVSAAKAATNAILAGEIEPAAADSEGKLRKLADLTRALADDLEALAADDYLAVLLYVAPAGSNRQRAASLREALQQRTRGAVTVQFGPRYLHSTGQLHKGGPAKGHFIVVEDLHRVGKDVADIAIAGSDFTTGELVRAQMQGDITVLKERGKPVHHYVVGG